MTIVGGGAAACAFARGWPRSAALGEPGGGSAPEGRRDMGEEPVGLFGDDGDRCAFGEDLCEAVGEPPSRGCNGVGLGFGGAGMAAAGTM